MNAITAPKSPAQNRLEGFALIALFQGLPTFAAAVLVLKVMGAREIVAEPRGAAIFVVSSSLLYALLVPRIASWFPRMKNGYEPLFYDASLSVSDKIAQRRSQPRVSGSS
jgi:hypothetical protein